MSQKFDISERENFHTIANKEPLMNQQRFKLLYESMKRSGYREGEPITMYEDKILDGRNRFLAADAAGVTPVYRTFSGTYEEAEQESRDLNNNRRHNTPHQDAMAAAMEVADRREQRKINKSLTLLSIPMAAKAHGTKTRNVNRAMSILKRDPNMAKSVFKGCITMQIAIQILDEKDEAVRKAEVQEHGDYIVNDRQQELVKRMRDTPIDMANSYMELENTVEELKNKVYELSSELGYMGGRNAQKLEI